MWIRFGCGLDSRIYGNSTMTCQHKHNVLNGTSFSCNSPTNCSGSTVQRELTFCLEPSMLIAVSRIKTRAKWPGLHNSFSSWPIITASESISTSGSMPFRFACFDVMENGPEWQIETQKITTPQLMLLRIYSCQINNCKEWKKWSDLLFESTTVT